MKTTRPPQTLNNLTMPSRLTRQTQLLALSFAHHRLVTAQDNDEVGHGTAFIDETLSALSSWGGDARASA
jgi:hypothetical protein